MVLKFAGVLVIPGFPTPTTSSDMPSLSVTATQGDDEPSEVYLIIMGTLSGILAILVVIIIFLVIVVLVLLR